MRLPLLEDRRQSLPDGMAEVQPANPHPEVLLSTFSGGAHCCNDTRLLTSSPDVRRWFEVRRDPVNGSPNGASDPLGPGRYLLADVDNRHQPAMLPLHRRRLQEMESWVREPADQRTEASGFLTVEVATKALVGDVSTVAGGYLPVGPT